MATSGWGDGAWGASFWGGFVDADVSVTGVAGTTAVGEEGVTGTSVVVETGLSATGVINSAGLVFKFGYLVSGLVEPPIVAVPTAEVADIPVVPVLLSPSKVTVPTAPVDETPDTR